MQMLLLLRRKSWSNVPILCGEQVGQGGDANSNSRPNMDLQQPASTSEDTMIAVQDLKWR